VFGMVHSLSAHAERAPGHTLRPASRDKSDDARSGNVNQILRPIEGQNPRATKDPCGKPLARFAQA